MDSSSRSAMLAAGIGATFQLIRVSIDLISTATIHQSKKEEEIESEKTALAVSKEEKKKGAEATPLLVDTDIYGSINDDSDHNMEMAQGPIQLTSGMDHSGVERHMALASLVIHVLLALYFVVASVMTGRYQVEAVYSHDALVASCTLVCLGIVVQIRDYRRIRFGAIQRTFYVLATVLAFLGCTCLLWRQGGTTRLDRITFAALLIYVATSLLESTAFGYPTVTPTQEGKKPTLSRNAILTMLKPYFWPDATSNSALLNRTLAILTWVCVILSKAFNLWSPLLLGWASTALAQRDYGACVKYSIGYALIQFLSSAFKEGQSLVYLKVAQAAYVQLSEVSFHHIHSLSLDWHLRKKLGEVIRSMDRGITACDTLMKYLFLWLVPALAECVVVCVIFATYFDYLPLAVSVFYFVFVYIVWTTLVTLWRKKYRKAVVQSDNEWHDLCTDSLINFETVKYFTAESYEMKRFGDAVKRYQSGSVDVQASLSMLNITQKLILQTCLATSLSLAALGIQKRSDCCVEHGCDSGTSQCCTDLASVCTGMEVGDFVAVLTYTLNLFAPLNFLGSVYNAVVMAVIDLTNLSELLAESPDVTDQPDAMTLPRVNATDPDVAVEFDNVWFHYPTQPDTKGLKGLSFIMKRGTTTAIVGSTGAGKTTISRLLFRFYDVLGGAVKVNGVDVRTVSQKSLRGAMGVVPQSASMFNDTLRSNVLYGRRDATPEELEKAAEDAQLTGFIHSLDDGWETMVGDRGLKLSGGEKQRTAIARCLLKDPPFVVLDEATSALDTITENSVQEALDSLGSERTVLVIAHRLGTIRNADNIVVLDQGQVAEQGTHDELLELNGIYADMWNMQLNSTRTDLLDQS